MEASAMRYLLPMTRIRRWIVNFYLRSPTNDKNTEMNSNFLFDVDLKERIVKLKSKWRQENMKYIYVNIRERSKWKVWQYSKLCCWMQSVKLKNTMNSSKYVFRNLYLDSFVHCTVSRYFFSFCQCNLLHRTSTFIDFQNLYLDSCVHSGVSIFLFVWPM